MSKRESHLGAARKHGRVALNELRHMTADSALYWVLSHRTRVAQFRRSVRGTRAEKVLDQLLQRLRAEATPLPRRRKRKVVRARRRSRRVGVGRFFAPPPFPGL
jgi:hypothetical protein